MKQTNRDIGNYVKGRLKIEDNVKHAKNYILLHLKMFSRKPSLATWFIIVVNIMTIPMCFCESKISLPSSSSLSDGFDPSKINIEMGGFRPVYNPGTVEYVEHTIRRQDNVPTQLKHYGAHDSKITRKFQNFGFRQQDFKREFAAQPQIPWLGPASLAHRHPFDLGNKNNRRQDVPPEGTYPPPPTPYQSFKMSNPWLKYSPPPAPLTQQQLAATTIGPKPEFEALGFAQNGINAREYTEVDDMQNNRLRNPYEALSMSAEVRNDQVRDYDGETDQDYDLCLDLNICNGEEAQEVSESISITQAVTGAAAAAAKTIFHDFTNSFKNIIFPKDNINRYDPPVTKAVRYISDTQLPAPTIGPQLPPYYQWQDRQPSNVIFPEDENSISHYEPEIPDYNFSNNEVSVVHNENTLPHINEYDIADDNNLIVDGFWINEEYGEHTPSETNVQEPETHSEIEYYLVKEKTDIPNNGQRMAFSVPNTTPLPIQYKNVEEIKAQEITKLENVIKKDDLQPLPSAPSVPVKKVLSGSFIENTNKKSGFVIKRKKNIGWKPDTEKSPFTLVVDLKQKMQQSDKFDEMEKNKENDTKNKPMIEEEKRLDSKAHIKSNNFPLQEITTVMPDGEYKKDAENRRIIYGTVENNNKNRDKIKANGNQKSNTSKPKTNHNNIPDEVKLQDRINIDSSKDEKELDPPNLSDSQHMMYTSNNDDMATDDNLISPELEGIKDHSSSIYYPNDGMLDVDNQKSIKPEVNHNTLLTTQLPSEGEMMKDKKKSKKDAKKMKTIKKERMKFMNVKNKKKMVNDMQFKDKTPLYTAVVKPSQRLQQPDEYIDPKYEAVLKQVREFLYQNMNLETKVVVNTLRRLIPHGKGMVKRLDNQPRMEDVFTTNSRADQDAIVNLTDEHLFVFYSTLLELQKILESALVLTKKNAGERYQGINADENNRPTVPLLTKMRYQSMLPVLEMASVHNVELVKFFFKLLYKADTRRNMQDVPKDSNTSADELYDIELIPIKERKEARQHFAFLNKLLPFM